MKIRKLSERDREILVEIMEIVAEEMASSPYQSDILYNVKRRVAKHWERADEEAVFAAMERGWDEGKGWLRGRTPRR